MKRCERCGLIPSAVRDHRIAEGCVEELRVVLAEWVTTTQAFAKRLIKSPALKAKDKATLRAFLR